MKNEKKKFHNKTLKIEYISNVSSYRGISKKKASMEMFFHVMDSIQSLQLELLANIKR